MTPKEKAKELVEKFSNGILLTIDGGKLASLITIDEILKEVPTEILDTYKQQVNFIDNDRYYYWQEVKQEIELL